MMKQYPVHRSLVAVDIEGYSRRRNQGHVELRSALRRILADAFDIAGVEIAPTEQQDQGDGFLTLVRPEVSKVVLVDGLIREIENGLRRYNRYQTEEGKIRLRVALHSGELHIDEAGFPGEATVTVMRLIEAEQVKTALGNAPRNIAVIVSDSLYWDVVAHDYAGIVHEEYVQVEVAVKTFRGPAWIRVPGCPVLDAVPNAAPGQPSAAAPSGDAGEGQQRETRSAVVPGSWFTNAHFAGPTSIGGYAAGRDINVKKRGRQP